MRSIAESLGLSAATVSLILKGRAREHRISPATEKRVLKEVERLDYRPDYFAASLRGKASGVVGVILPDIFERFMGELVKGIEDVLYPSGRAMILSTSRFSLEHEIRMAEELLHRRADGLLVVPTMPFGGREWRYPHLSRAASEIALVQIDRRAPDVDAAAVLQDDYRAARRGARLLLSRGCRRPLLVSLDVAASSLAERRRGFRDELREEGVEACPPILLGKCDRDSDDLEQALRDTFASEHAPDGLFVTTRGIGGKCAALLSGLFPAGKMPPLLRFGGDDPYLFSGSYCLPQPHYEMGRKAAELLLEIIDGGEPREIRVPYPAVEYRGCSVEEERTPFAGDRHMNEELVDETQ